MDYLAKEKLMKNITALEDWYGVDVTILIEVMDRYTRYYQHNENQKRELECAYNDFKEGIAGAGIDNLLLTIKDVFISDDRSVNAINEDVFDLSMLKKFIADLGVVFALNSSYRKEMRVSELQKVS